MSVQLENSRSKTIFLHVVKTGGVTFRSILTATFGDAFQLCYDPSIAAIETAMASAACLEFHTFQHQGRLTNMHAELDRLDRWDLLQGQNIFTMLREPVDQSVSLFYHMQRKRPRVEKLYRAYGSVFPETLDQYLESAQHFNTQTAFLANRQQLSGDHVATRADLNKAKELLVRMNIHVGLTERFADSMNVFEHVTGRRVPDAVTIQNQNHDRLPLDRIAAGLKQRIRERSELDVELYAFARQLFLEDLARCRPTRGYVFTPAVARSVSTMQPGVQLEAQAC